MTATDPTAERIAAEDEAERVVPMHVINAVGDATTIAEVGPAGSVSSELVHRVMRVTYEATIRGARQ